MRRLVPPRRLALASAIKPVVVIYVVAGLLAVANALLMDEHPRPRLLVVGLGLVDGAVGIDIAALPWQRWPQRAVVALVLFSFLAKDLLAAVRPALGRNRDTCPPAPARRRGCEPGGAERQERRGGVAARC